MRYSTGYTNMINDFEEITDSPSSYPSNLLKRAINDAYVVYDHGNMTYAKYEQIWRICSEELEMRGEPAPTIKPQR